MVTLAYVTARPLPFVTVACGATRCTSSRHRNICDCNWSELSGETCGRWPSRNAAVGDGVPPTAPDEKLGGVGHCGGVGGESTDAVGGVGFGWGDKPAPDGD